MKLHFTFLLTLVLVTSMTGLLQAEMVLSDDFEDGTLNTSLWVALDGGAATVTESGGAVQITNAYVDRAYLATVGAWNPADGAITVSGTANIPATGGLEIWMRASASYDSLSLPNGTGVLGSGLNVGIWLEADEVGASQGVVYKNLSGLAKKDTVWPWSGFGAETLTPTTGPTNTAWNFVITDDGATITSTFTEVGNPANIGTYEGASSFDEGTYHITFGGINCELTNVTISQVPEPSTIALLLTLAGSLFLVRKR